MDVWREATNNWSQLRVAMGCRRIRIRGGLAHTYPIQRSGTFYNSAFVQSPHCFSIEEVERLYAKRKLPFGIILPSLKPYGELGKSLEEEGYSVAPAWTLMTLKELTGGINPEVRVVEIDRSKLGEWFELLDVFPHAESSRATRREMIERVAKEKSAQLLIASLQGRFVGAGLLFMKDKVTSIHMIATLTEFRRRHVATTVSLEAIRRARKGTAGLVWLRTRKGGIGEKVYARIGFTPFSDILSYTKTPEYEDANLPPK
jgi:ribosomal protein S18 acetylase RimI-like enzyme